MNDLRFSVERWTGQGPDPERITRGLLRIEAGGLCLTRNEDAWSRSVGDAVHVSMYPLASWLVWNWWRLCYEPLPAGHVTTTWRCAHEMGAAGGGYLWPHLTFSSDGERIRVTGSPSPSSSREPVQYLRGSDSNVPIRPFQEALRAFIDLVVARLKSNGIQDSELERGWNEVSNELHDEQELRSRRLEALLGLDPDDATPERLEFLAELSRSAGEESAQELAAIASEHDGKDLERLREAALNGVGAVSSWRRNRQGESVAALRRKAQDRLCLPWQRGLEVARELRRIWGLGADPLDDKGLEERIGLAPGQLSSSKTGRGLSAALAIERDDGVKLILSSRPPVLRKFEAARLIGDLIGSPEADRWHPATRAKTARQQYQRAFAAEFLCPVEGLRDRLQDRSEESVSEAAAHFGVSEWAVQHQIHNNLDP